MKMTTIAQKTLLDTVNRFESVEPDTILTINKKIQKKIFNSKFEVKITQDDVPNILDIGFALCQYYKFKGFGVFFSTGDKKLDVKPYLVINWEYDNINKNESD